MKHPLFRIGTLFALALSSTAAAFTGIDKSIFNFPKTRTFEMTPIIGVGSLLTQSGHITRVTTSYKEGPGAPFESKCEGTLTMDDQKTIEVSVELPSDIRGDDPRAEIRLFQVTALCELLQTAFSEGWKITASGRISRMGETGPAASSIYRLEAESRTEEGFSALPDYACPVPSCQAKGEVVSLAIETRDGYAACSAGFKVDGENESVQKATLQVNFPKSDAEYRWLSPTDGHAYLHGKFRTCLGMITSAAADQSLTVIGNVGGSRIIPTSLSR